MLGIEKESYLNKEEIIKLAEGLYKSVLDANQYYLIMLQYEEFYEIYSDEMNLSPAFYKVVYGALQKACFMEIAKLYDKTKNAVSIGWLLKCCENNLDLFREYRGTITNNKDGIEETFQIPYQHYLKPTEECFYVNKVKSQREILKLCDIPNNEKVPVRIDLKFSDFLGLYQQRFNSLSKKQEKIRVQRNEIYAHNDRKQMLGKEKIWKNSYITHSDIKELIDFAFDCTKLLIGVLTGIVKPEKYTNIKDWENTLKLIKVTLKNQNNTK